MAVRKAGEKRWVTVTRTLPSGAQISGVTVPLGGRPRAGYATSVPVINRRPQPKGPGSDNGGAVMHRPTLKIGAPKAFQLRGTRVSAKDRFAGIPRSIIS